MNESVKNQFCTKWQIEWGESNVIELMVATGFGFVRASTVTVADERNFSHFAPLRLYGVRSTVNSDRYKSKFTIINKIYCVYCLDSLPFIVDNVDYRLPLTAYRLPPNKCVPPDRCQRCLFATQKKEEEKTVIEIVTNRQTFFFFLFEKKKLRLYHHQQ